MHQHPESPLAYLGFQLHPPSAFLRPYVQWYWYFQRDTPLAIYHEEYMHPHGRYGIVFNFGDTLYLDGQAVHEPVFLDGVNTISRRMGFFGKVELMGISFQEGGAYPLLGVPLHEVRNAITLLDVLHCPELLRLHARLQEAETFPARIHLLEGWLIQRFLPGREPHPLIPASLAVLQQTGGQFPIPELAREFAISQRQLERLYQAQVGVSPKQYAQLVRVETARLALKKLREHTTTRLAMELGFYDQAHFIREFSAVVGMTPYTYLKRSHKS